MFETTLRRYNGVAVNDDGVRNSAMFLDLAKRIKKDVVMFEEPTKLCAFRIGHYEVSGYLKRCDKYVYFAYSVPRGFIPLDMGDDTAFGGILYRTAKSPQDSTGGVNHFTNFYRFENDVNDLFAGSW